MFIRHIIKNAFPLKGKLHIPDVLGMSIAHLLKPGATLRCTFQSPAGDEFDLEGTVAFELINYKGRSANPEQIGGSLIFGERPGGEIPLGWTLLVLIED